jgi:hypothetical protein
VRSARSGESEATRSGWVRRAALLEISKCVEIVKMVCELAFCRHRGFAVGLLWKECQGQHL